MSAEKENTSKINLEPKLYAILDNLNSTQLEIFYDKLSDKIQKLNKAESSRIDSDLINKVISYLKSKNIFHDSISLELYKFNGKFYADAYIEKYMNHKNSRIELYKRGVGASIKEAIIMLYK